MKIRIKHNQREIEGTESQIVEQMADNQWNDLGADEYMREAAYRAKIQTGVPVRPWNADLFLKDLIRADLIEII